MGHKINQKFYCLSNNSKNMTLKLVVLPIKHVLHGGIGLEKTEPFNLKIFLHIFCNGGLWPANLLTFSWGERLVVRVISYHSLASVSMTTVSDHDLLWPADPWPLVGGGGKSHRHDSLSIFLLSLHLTLGHVQFLVWNLKQVFNGNLRELETSRPWDLVFHLWIG